MSQALLSERAPFARRLASASALDSGVAAIGAGLAVGGLAAAAGGYFPTSWGWTAIAFLWATAIALLLRGTVELGVPELVFFGAFTLFVGWIWLATTWSESTPSSFLEGERALVYVGGAAAALLLVRRRLQLVTAFALAAAAPAISVAIASRSSALTHDTSSISAAAHDGKRLAIVVIAAAIVSAALMLALVRAERAIRPRVWVRVAYAGLLLALLAGALAAAVARYGSPPTMARKAYDAFITPPQNGEATLNSRLFSLYGSHRAQLWHVAWHDYEAHPWLGSGPGTYEQEWNQHRTITLKVRDAHSLYLEQLAEVGPVGLGLLAIALGMPLVAAAGARGVRLAGPALAAYVAFLVHAAVDWDWEVTAVTLSALLCGIAVLALARSEDREERSFVLPVRLTAVGATGALAALAFVGLVGNLALASSTHAAGRGDWK